MTTTLYGWGTMFDLPSPSPFVIKADVQLQMLGVEFDRAIADLSSVPKEKAPYVHDDGVLIEDSTFIRWHFERKLGRDLDQGLSRQQRGTAWGLGTMLEQRLVAIIVQQRWLDDGNFDRGPRQFFMGVPEAMREGAIAQARGAIAATMHGNGIARFTSDELHQLAAADIAAVSQILGDGAFLFGDEPTAVDAIAFGVLGSCATRFFDSGLPDLIAAHINLTDYLGRMQQSYFPTERWPAMG